MLDISTLRKGDILLSTGDATVSFVIRSATGSDFSHAALYIGNGNIIEAVGDGVQLKSLTVAMSDDSLVAAYRRRNMSAAQADVVVNYARRQLGKPYDGIGAAGGGVTSGRGILIGLFMSPLATGIAVTADINNRLNPESSFYCSELVALAFAEAGIPLGSGSASTTPEDINDSNQLVYMGKLKG